MGLEWVGATRLSGQVLADQNKDIGVDDMGYGTSFGFRLPGHFFGQADEVKPALFVPLWGFLGEVSRGCKYAGNVGQSRGAWVCRLRAHGAAGWVHGAAGWAHIGLRAGYIGLQVE